MTVLPGGSPGRWPRSTRAPRGSGIDTLRQDLLYAVRRLRQAPGFTLVAVATLALGLAGALLLSHTIASMLFSLGPRDPATLGGGAVLLLATALLASDLPARRARRVDPVIALRSE